MIDLADYDEAMREAGQTAERFAAELTDALRDVALEGRSFEDALRSMALSMADAALNSAMEPVERGVAGLFGQLAGGLVNGLGGAMGGGAASDGFGAVGPGAFPPAPVTLNVTTPNAASFRRSEGQIAAMLARTASRGRRSL